MPARPRDAALALAKVHGFLVERQAIVTGTPQDFRGSPEEEQAHIYDQVRRKHGERGEIEFRKFVARMRGLAGAGELPLIEHDDD